MWHQKSLKALIVNTQNEDNLTLYQQCCHLGLNVEIALTKEELQELLDAELPEIIFFDANFAKTINIINECQSRQEEGGGHIPIIHIIEKNDNELIAQSYDSGADDIIYRPFTHSIIKRKIEIWHNIISAFHETHGQHLIAQQEQESAIVIYDSIVKSGCLNDPAIQYYTKAVSLFNGDVILASYSPAGNIIVFLGDFTSHGLSAAIGALPAADIFYGMVKKGLHITQIVAEVNQKLHAILPTGIYCAAACVELLIRKGKVQVWNGGLPPVYLIDNNKTIKKTFQSKHLPLGVLGKEQFDTDFEVIEVERTDSIYLFSDGVIEAVNEHEQFFGKARVEHVFETAYQYDSCFDRILTLIKNFTGGYQQDDISLVEVDISKSSLEHEELLVQQTETQSSNWYITFDLPASVLKSHNPLATIINSLMEKEELREHRNNIFTVVHELYDNALDYGVLRMPPKNTIPKDEINSYYSERKKRLSALEEGHILLKVSSQVISEGGEIVIWVEDSGQGFDFHTTETVDDNSSVGVDVVRKLCKSVEYVAPGNKVLAVYRY